jgi:hypothetical protein
MAVWARVKETPSEHESSRDDDVEEDKDEEEGEITPSTHPLCLKTSPRLVIVGAHKNFMCQHIE